jgi:transposase
MGSERDPETVEKWVSALDLRKRGKTYREIGEALGVSHVTAYEWVGSALTATLREPSEAVRQIEAERLDALIKAIWPGATRENNPDYDAVDRVLKVMDRRAKLLGLDAPTKHVVETEKKQYDVTTSPDDL